MARACLLPPAFHSGLQAARLDAEALRLGLEDRASGGVCIFEGRVRDHHQGRAVTALAYEAYGPLAEAVLKGIVDEARRRWDLGAAVAVHRTGPVPIGELAVWLGAASPHREEAFAACRYMIEEVKRRLPVWKHESYGDGTQAWSRGLALEGAV